ncbi:hypothetical protein NS263_14595 [Curtobacterium oceanosedimentum]|uniref:Uncharacterized protein n=1 Tax=Curtobacterium oceanosedimentum TaxID=465820 RepID=A0ABR5S489_9MICO|nr:hypothetical protein NS263_14595 [Curtobacterium oceanosedimentum]
MGGGAVRADGARRRRGPGRPGKRTAAHAPRGLTTGRHSGRLARPIGHRGRRDPARRRVVRLQAGSPVRGTVVSGWWRPRPRRRPPVGRPTAGRRTDRSRA